MRANSTRFGAIIPSTELVRSRFIEFSDETGLESSISDPDLFSRELVCKIRKALNNFQHVIEIPSIHPSAAA